MESVKVPAWFLRKGETEDQARGRYLDHLDNVERMEKARKEAEAQEQERRDQETRDQEEKDKEQKNLDWIAAELEASKAAVALGKEQAAQLSEDRSQDRASTAQAIEDLAAERFITAQAAEELAAERAKLDQASRDRATEEAMQAEQRAQEAALRAEQEGLAISLQEAAEQAERSARDAAFKDQMEAVERAAREQTAYSLLGGQVVVLPGIEAPMPLEPGAEGEAPVTRGPREGKSRAGCA